MHPALLEYAKWVEGGHYTEALESATRIVNAVVELGFGDDITFDEDDGLDFIFRLRNGWKVMANVYADGTLDASVYDDSKGLPVRTVKRIRREDKVPEPEAEFIALIQN